MPRIDVLGVEHTYDLTTPVASGPVLVFVHGWLLSRRYWMPLIEQLAPSYQCLSYDLRGFGESRLPEVVSSTQPLDAKSMRFDREVIAANVGLPEALSPYSLAAYAQDLVVLLKQLNIPRAWIVGHSLGGSIALWAATLAPQVVEGVVCLNAGGGIYYKEAFDQFRQAGQQMLGVRPRWLPYFPCIDLLFSRIMVASPLQRDWGRQRVVDFVAAHPEAALRSLLDSTSPEEVHRLPQVVSQIQQPVYFLAGLQDRVMEPRYVYHLASFHPGFCDGTSAVIEIPNCGHMGMLEQTDVVASHLHAIVSSQDCVCPPSYAAQPYVSN
ncbi:MAG TPA: alpha/beta hydrolase [Stenomitos sp.]